MPKRRMIGKRFRGLDEGLASRDRRGTRQKIETVAKIGSGFAIAAPDQGPKSRFDSRRDSRSRTRWLKDRVINETRVKSGIELPDQHDGADGGAAWPELLLEINAIAITS